VVPRRRHDPFRRPALFVRRQLAGGDQLAEDQLGHRRPLPGVRVEDHERRRRRHEKGQGMRRAEDKKRKKSSNGEGMRWQEQDEGESAGD
jgi:hypothetical protein